MQPKHDTWLMIALIAALVIAAIYLFAVPPRGRAPETPAVTSAPAPKDADEITKPAPPSDVDKEPAGDLRKNLQ